MKTRIPLSVSHPALYAARQRHLKPFCDTAGLVLTLCIATPILAFCGGCVVFWVLGMSAK